MYERGLASLTKTLGGSEEQVLRRARFAALRGRAIIVVRSLLATLVWFVRLVLIGNLFGSGWGIVAALPDSGSPPRCLRRVRRRGLSTR